MPESHFPFYVPELARDGEPTPDALEQAAAVLTDPAVSDLIARGELTVAMIRPSVDEAITQPTDSDAAAALEIESRIQSLGVLAKFSLELDTAAVEEFYGGGHAAPMTPFPPARYMVFANRMEEFSALMTGGPTTVLLLAGQDAIAAWRSQLGHWDINTQRDPDTIRGQLGVSNYNNLLHGSDSSESAQRELGVLLRCIQRRLSAAQDV